MSGNYSTSSPPVLLVESLPRPFLLKECLDLDRMRDMLKSSSNTTFLNVERGILSAISSAECQIRWHLMSLFITFALILFNLVWSRNLSTNKLIS
eukprot:767529-Hanusia_phi.AAC.9